MKKVSRNTFEAKLLPGDKGAAIEVPFDPAKLWAIPSMPLWPGRRGHTVRGELNGISFGSCIVARSKKFWRLVDEEIQERAASRSATRSPFPLSRGRRRMRNMLYSKRDEDPGQMDMMWPLWNVLDATSERQANWYAPLNP